MFDFLGRVVVITGAAGNLGYAVAQAFQGAGARLVLVDRAADRLPRIFSPDICPRTVSPIGPGVPVQLQPDIGLRARAESHPRLFPIQEQAIIRIPRAK